MKMIVTADLHFGDNPRDEYRHAFVPRLSRLLDKKQPDALAILGDLTEEKNNHDARLVNRIVEHIRRLASSCKVYILCGNHDYENEGQAFFKFLDALHGVTFIDEPKIWNMGGLGRCAWLPHTNDYEIDWGPKKIINGKFDWVFAHNTFAGADVGHGRTMPGIPPAIFKNVNGKVVSGDVHVPQTFGPITYVGAPYAVDFGDDYEPRVLLLDDGEMISIKQQGAQKRLVHLKKIGELANVFANQEINEGDILKVRCEIAEAARAQWADMQEAIREWGKKNRLIVHAIQPIVKKEGGGSFAQQAAPAARSDGLVLEDFATQRGLAERTVKMGRKIMRTV